MALATESRATGTARALVERDALLATLRANLEQASAGSGRLVLVRGEAGIGKTALIRRFVGSLDAGVTVVTGSADGVSTARPFEPLYEMSLGDTVPALLSTAAPRAEVFPAFVDAIRSLNVRILVVEDMQWADDASLELLLYLARRLESMRVLVLASVRDEADAPSGMRRLLGTLASIPTVYQLELPRLTLRGVAEMVGDADIDAAALHSLTAGNPFFVTEVLATGMGTIPVSVRDVIQAKVQRLSATGLAAIECLAVLGSRAEPWTLAAVAGEDVLGIDECLAAGMVTKEQGIAFRHELTRLAVLDELPVFRGIAIHRRALAALVRAKTPDHARLAYHAEGAADAASTVRYAVAAGREAAAVSANREAQAQFRRARRFAHALAPVEHAELLECLANVLYLTNELGEAVEIMNEALEIRRSAGDPLRVADDLRALGFIGSLAGRAAEGWTLLEQARELLVGLGDTRELGRTYATLARMGVMQHRADDETRDWAARAIAIARRVDDAETLVSAMISEATRAWSVGDAAARDRLVEALARARAARLTEQVDRALNNLGACSADLRQLRDSLSYYDEYEEFSVRSELEGCNVSAARAEVLLELGRWDDADRAADLALRVPRSIPINRALTLIVKAKLATRRGNPDWHDLIEEAGSLMPDLPNLSLLWALSVARAEAAWHSGTLPDLLTELRSAYELMAERGTPWARADLAAWLRRAGSAPTADIRAPVPHRLLAQRRHREAADAFDQLEMPYEAALALTESDDVADLRSAHARLVSLRADATAALVSRRIRELGGTGPRGPRPSTRRHLAGLTEREAEVARLVATGLTNREIADRLVVTEKTVSHHVSAVLGKLSARRRAEIGLFLSSAAHDGRSAAI